MFLRIDLYHTLNNMGTRNQILKIEIDFLNRFDLYENKVSYI